MLSIEPEKANRLVNGGPVMILSCRREARVNMMAVSWLSWISTCPPLLGVSISPSCFSHDIIRETGDFVLNVPNAEMIPTVHQVGTTTGRSVDKMRVFDLVTVWGRTVKALTLSYAIGVLECQVTDFRKIGDHTFFIAKVLYAAVDETAWEDGHWSESAGLVYYLGGDKYLTGGKIVRPKVKTDYLTLRQAMHQRRQETLDLFDDAVPPPLT